MLTAVGTLRLRRAYFVCPGCHEAGHLADAALGIDGYLSPQATRLACLAGACESFAKAERLLRELAGWDLSDEAVRRACLAEAKAVADWRATDDGCGASFRQAAGELEFQTDAAKVNTDTGWRDMKLGVFAKRPLGAAAKPEEWESRQLPRPAARVAFAAIETSEQFGARWPAWAARLGADDPALLSVLGDGAEWIWNEAGRHFPGSRQCLDIFHAAEHIGTAAKALYGEGSPEAAAWLSSGREALLKDGWWGICAHIGQALAEGNAPGRQAALDDLTGYFAKHTERLGYCQRLSTGRSIGSGLVEGAVKEVIGKRLKQTGARWLVGNANRMAELCCLAHGNGWDDYWLRN